MLYTPAAATCSLPAAAALDSPQVLKLFWQACSVDDVDPAQQHYDMPEGGPAALAVLAMFAPLAEWLTEQAALWLLRTAVRFE
jgi:hypothetical protein